MQHLLEAFLLGRHADDVDGGEEGVGADGVGEAGEELGEVDEVHAEQDVLVQLQDACGHTRRHQTSPNSCVTNGLGIFDVGPEAAACRDNTTK